MKPIKIDLKIQRPNKKDIEEMWRDIEIELVEKDFEFINTLKTCVSSEIYFKGFLISEQEIFDWFCSRGRLHEINFETNFLLSNIVLKSFPLKGYSNEEKASSINGIPEFEYKSGFMIDGELSKLLHSGGAYGPIIQLESKLIKESARKFCMQLFDEEYDREGVLFMTSRKAWNSWFDDFMIDYSYLIVCKKTRIIWLLAFTDMA